MHGYRRTPSIDNLSLMMEDFIFRDIGIRFILHRDRYTQKIDISLFSQIFSIFVLYISTYYCTVKLPYFYGGLISMVFTV